MNDELTRAMSGWADSLVNLVPVLSGSDETASMAQVRASYTTFQAQQKPPQGVRFEEVNMGGVPATLALPDEQNSDIVLVYIHGGAYIVGEPAGYRGIGGNYAKLLGARVYIPDYRLAPEHPFPAAIDDGLRAYEWLLEQGIPARKIAFAGESAGGAMVVSVMVAAKHKGLPLPAAGVAISPWANLEHTGASMTNREGLDPLNTKPLLDLLARTFLAGALPNHPLASPVFADVTGLPPILVQIGENELMLSDAIRLASHLAENRVRVNLEVWPQMPHAWHFFQSFLPEAEQALRESARFISETVGSAK
ncbi:alpha/beta hydrolase [Burkholderia sp. LMU1-1-1.1]|uniref:alpha/beta hydrolase n=1 Tax=Burkholderia sp. LMU1-1-1.1 TaxID=3135266 RepID=UPI0028E3C9C8|nr:alpha/beta hydrolase [uncultured Duganella sp.]